MKDEGYIKFDLHWEKKSIEMPGRWKALNEVRTKLYKLGLIGMYDDGIGFGNVSARVKGEYTKTNFLISGTQTGQKHELTENDYSLVTDFSIEENEVWCRGEVKASSESMTHAAIYAANAKVKSVLHIHSEKLWSRYLYRYPSTDKDIPYGTLEMARSLQQTVVSEPFLPVIMGGHREGIICYGRSSKEAYSKVLDLLNEDR